MVPHTVAKIIICDCSMVSGDHLGQISLLILILRIAYRIVGNFRGRKLSRIGSKGAFRGENFRGMLKLVA